MMSLLSYKDQRGWRLLLRACVCVWEGGTAVMVPQWVALHKIVSAEVRLDADLMKRCVCV